jgi:nitrogen regulatory protein P-II 1
MALRTGSFNARAVLPQQAHVLGGERDSLRSICTRIITGLQSRACAARHLVKQALIDIGVDGMTVSEVRGHARQKGHKESYRGGEYTVDLLPKVKLELILQDNIVDSAVAAILKTASTGKIGDGKIFLYKVEEAIRIRSQERGAAAL